MGCQTGLKMYYVIFSVIVIVALSGLAAAANVNINQGWHPLQQIARSSSDLTLVDDNANGVIDNSDACSGDSACEANSLVSSGYGTFGNQINILGSWAQIQSLNPGAALEMKTVQGGNIILNTTGNVLIGASGSPAEKLDVKGNVSSDYFKAATGLCIGTDCRTIWPSAGTALPAGTSGQTLRHDGTNWVANSMLFNNGNSIGIGTTSPGEKLEVSGNIRLSGASPTYRVTNLADPVNNQDAATKFYVDALAAQSGHMQAASYVTPGTYSFSVPSSVVVVWVTAWGGGGGGGGRGNWQDPSNPYAGGGGGGGGGETHFFSPVTLNGEQTVTVTVGAGGSGGAIASNGGNGGTSGFGSYLTASGGGGGSAGRMGADGYNVQCTNGGNGAGINAGAGGVCCGGATGCVGFEYYANPPSAWHSVYIPGAGGGTGGGGNNYASAGLGGSCVRMSGGSPGGGYNAQGGGGGGGSFMGGGGGGGAGFMGSGGSPGNGNAGIRGSGGGGGGGGMMPQPSGTGGGGGSGGVIIYWN